MARKDEINLSNLENLRQKSSTLAYGLDTQLSDEQEQINNIIRQTIIGTKKKLGERATEKPVSYYSQLQFGNAFNEFLDDNKKNKKANDASNKNLNDFKKQMNENPSVDISGLLMEDGTRSLKFSNFRIIHQHIPECSQALNIYKDNIMSPDDYTKLIFNITYDQAENKERKKEVEAKLDDLTIKYELEEKADKIIEGTLELGEQYVAVLSLEDELDLMLDSTGSRNLNEQAILLDKNAINFSVLSENIEMTKDSLNALNEVYGLTEESKMLTEDAAKAQIANLINENVQIGSAKELLLERIEAENDKHKNDIDASFYKKNGRKPKATTKDGDYKPIGISGSVIRILEPERVCELKVGEICYGYYYAEDASINNPTNRAYLGNSSGRNANGIMSLAQNNTIQSTTQSTYDSNNSSARLLGVGELKLRMISDMFLNGISKKIDKDFVRNHKEFKDFIYDLVRQKYIIEKGLRLTYFKPDEVIKFEAQPVYKDITFFAKLYLSILTNNLLIKLGRAHDKRVFYVNVGADAAYEQAIQSVIEDIKTKDYKMENLNDFNTVLNLAPGRFDDYYMPTVNGERPVEIDTLPGMDVDMNNDFMEYLKNSLMSGMGVPRNLIDVTSEVDYARSISAMNANFVRSVIRYQKKLTGPFTRLYQKLYENEFKFLSDGSENVLDIVDISAIKVSFPSPATLAMTNISDQIQSVDANAEFIATQLVPIKQDGSSEDKRQKMKIAIVKDLLPGIDWDKYEEMLKGIDQDIAKEKLENGGEQPVDPYNNNY